ncbi:MAG: hypothetical protein FJ118_12390 [Deltaproteobacteria bacterium]|nr:hypothetical protein [Deltaproteobacteria bacterium]
MSILPTIRDDNGNTLVGHGTELFTTRYSGVDTSGRAIALAIDVKGVLVHIEGSAEVARLTGTVSGSEPARFTQDGLTVEHLPLVKQSGETLLTVAAASGAVNVSVLAWR